MPDDAAVVVVAGPRTDFFPNEIDALKKYLDKAGKVLLELDPPDKPDSPPLTNLIALAHDWGRGRRQPTSSSTPAAWDG